MRFGILGPLEVSAGSQRIGVHQPKQRALLAILLVHANQTVSTDRLIDLLWPRDSPADPANTLRFHVSKLRNSLSQNSEGLSGHEVIATRAPGYMLEVERDDLDAYRFHDLAATARELAASDQRRGMALMQEALHLWRGPVLTEFEYELFARETVLRYDEMRLTLLEDALAIAIDVGQGDQAIAELEALTTEYPFRERLACLLMLALFRHGRQAEALRACQRLRSHLVEELGIDPSEATRELEQRILDQDPTLLDQAPGPVVRPVSRRVKDFEISGRLGEGRFGIVFRARQLSVGRDVALKSIRPEYAKEPEFLRRFEAEGQLVARLEHPHIVPLYDFWRSPDGAYLAMRYLRGGSLKESLQVGKWRPERLARLVEQVAAAASAAHTQGVIHRDIKPANILLDEDGNGYLSDFGIAKFLDAAGTMTGSGNAPLTPAYVAPELLEGSGSPSPRSDVYSLALVSYEALRGAHPYETDSVSALVNHQLHDPLPPLDDMPAVSEVIARAAAKDPDERYADARQFARDLSAAAGEHDAAPFLVADPADHHAHPEPDIGDFINDTAPFGPIAMDEISAPALYRDLYDSDNRLYREITQRSPSFIVGRRGAGKTALMRVPLLDPANLLVEFKSADLFAQVLACVDALEQQGSRIFVNQIADIWEGIVWTGMCLATLRVADTSSAPQAELRTLQRYVAGYGEAAAMTVDSISAEHCRRIAETARLRAITVIGMEVSSGGVKLADAKHACLAIQAGAGRSPIVLIDTMEDLHVEVHTLARVLAGLFGLIGRTDRSPHPDVRFRFCYPSELWGKLSEFAANPLKDAENHIKIFWHARELIRIAGHRLSLYIGLNHPDVLRKLFGKRQYDASSYDDARTVLGHVLPKKVVNDLGAKEDTLAYTLRHTQLLPRHFLQILNGVMRGPKEEGALLEVSPEAVVDGVRRVDELLVTEVFTAYSTVHPQARETCRRVIPELATSFSDGQLHRVFNQTGIRKRTGLEFFDFREMLLEIGCIGRVIGYTDRYVEGEFDYTLPTPLFPGSDDDLCLHPLFSRVFRARTGVDDPKRATLPVYPYGADPDHQPTW